MKPQTLADAGKKKGSIAGSVQSREYIFVGIAEKSFAFVLPKSQESEKRKAEQEIRIA